MSIKIFDGFFPTTVINKVVEDSAFYTWQFSRTDQADETYWTKHIYGKCYKKFIEVPDIQNFAEDSVKKTWDFFSDRYSLTLANLESCYLNGLTYGVESYPHIDSLDERAVTVICYICENWNSHWGGATVFYDSPYSSDPSNYIYYENNITLSALPRYNRIVIFKSNILHSVQPISKSFKGLRKTLMFKLINVDIESIVNHAN